MKDKGFRVETDYRNEKIGYKIRSARMEKVPYMLVMGDKEVEEGKVCVRTRGVEETETMTVEEFAEKLAAEQINKVY